MSAGNTAGVIFQLLVSEIRIYPHFLVGSPVVSNGYDSPARPLYDKQVLGLVAYLVIAVFEIQILVAPYHVHDGITCGEFFLIRRMVRPTVRIAQIKQVFDIHAQVAVQ